MYYKIDLNNYKPREVVNHLIINDFEELTSSQRQLINYQLVNFQDSFGKPWKEWDISDLKHRLENNFTFYLIGNGRDGLPLPVIEGWAFIDWNREYPHLNNRYVTPDFRNKGLGSDLVWLRCNEVKKRGLDTATIHMAHWNTPAHSVMKENIFTEIDDI